MKNIKLSSFLSLFFLSGCFGGDPPILSTPLPNGYSFNSNGGETGNIKLPSGLRMASYFGIIDSQHEAWCKEFAWESEFVVCIRSEYLSSSYEIRAIKYFVLNTTNENVKLLEKNKIKEYWLENTGKALPEMKTRYATTTSR